MTREERDGIINRILAIHAGVFEKTTTLKALSMFFREPKLGARAFVITATI